MLAGPCLKGKAIRQLWGLKENEGKGELRKHDVFLLVKKGKKQNVLSLAMESIRIGQFSCNPEKKVVISVQMEQKFITCVKTWQICTYRLACTQHKHTPGSWPVIRETCLSPNPR